MSYKKGSIMYFESNPCGEIFLYDNSDEYNPRTVKLTVTDLFFAAHPDIEYLINTIMNELNVVLSLSMLDKSNMVISVIFDGGDVRYIAEYGNNGGDTYNVVLTLAKIVKKVKNHRYNKMLMMEDILL